MGKSRSEYVFKNISISLVMQIIKNILSFISRTVFVYVLGAEYLGVNSLFTDILSVLSFAELGIGNAIVFSLYKPLAENDAEKINSLMKVYAKAYRIIGMVIAVLGVSIIPFLSHIIGDVTYVKENVTVLYLLFLLNSVISYFFVYKKSLIIADQKRYVVDIYGQIFFAIQVVAQTIFLLVTKEFFIYLLITIVSTFLNNFFVARKADKMYPYLSSENTVPLNKTELDDIVKNVKALVIYKIGGIILESTDSIFISSFINVATVGLYANYKMVVNVFKTIGFQIMDSIVASVGNLNASASTEKKESVFYEMFYICAWFFGFVASGMCCFLSPLVELWLGDSYTISFGAVLASCIYFCISNMHYPCYTYRTTAGLFIYGKYVPLVAAIINIVLDFVMVKIGGLTGIIWASIIARIFTYEIVDPLLVYKKVFQSSVRKYLLLYAAMATLIAVDCVISSYIISLISIGGILGFISKTILFSVSFNIIFFGITCKTSQFKSICQRVLLIVRRR